MAIPNLRAPLMALALLAACAPAHAVTLRVLGGTSADQMDGMTWQTAYRTIGAALSEAESGDEIWVGPGIYPESVTIAAGRRLYGGFIGTEVRREERRGLPDVSVLVAGAGGAAVTFSADAGPDTVLDGFTIRGACGTRAAVFCGGGSPTIGRNVIRENFPTGSVAGIDESGPESVIHSNLIIANTGVAVSGLGKFTNNTIAANMGAAYRKGGSGPVEFSGNIVAENLKGIAGFPEAGVARNNCVWGNTLVDFEGVTQWTGTNGNMSVDPRFAGPMHGNFALQPGSPCVDAAGSAAGGTDLRLRPRVIGAAADMGALEWDGRTWYPPARVIYVSPAGNDAHDGSSWANARATVGAALGSAGDGTEVWIAGGIYTAEDTLYLLPFVSIHGGFSGTEASLAARDGSAPPTALRNSAGHYILTATGGHRVSAMEGVTFQGTPGGTSSGVFCDGASPLIQRCSFTGIAGADGALLLGGVMSAPRITDCLIRGNRADQTAPGMIYFTDGSAPELERNILLGNEVQGTGGQGIIGMARSYRLILRNNVFARNTPGAAGWMTSDGLDALDVVNNTFVANAGPFGSIGLAKNIVFANNVFVDCPGAPPTGGFNNLYWRSGDASGSRGVDGNIEADPLFVDAGHDNFRLTTASPGRDAGLNIVIRPGETDADGAARIFNGRVDIGAYEITALPPMDAARRALAIAGGLAAAAPGDTPLDVDTEHGITVRDAALLLRTAR